MQSEPEPQFQHTNVSFRRLIPRLGKRELFFLLSTTCIFVRRNASYSGCLGKVALFYRYFIVALSCPSI